MTTLIAPEGTAIVTIKPAEATYENGLIVANAAKISDRAIVVASSIPDVEVADTVLLSGEYAGSSFTLDGKELVAVTAAEVIAVVETI